MNDPLKPSTDRRAMQPGVNSPRLKMKPKTKLKPVRNKTASGSPVAHQRLVRLPDCKIATLFLYLCKNGLPPWAQGGKKKQEKVLAMLTGWNLTRTAKAFESAVNAGYAEKPA